MNEASTSSGTGGLRSDARSLIDMVTVLQVGMREGAVLVAVEDQMTVLPKDAARLKAPRVVERTEDRCEKAFRLLA